MKDNKKDLSTINSSTNHPINIVDGEHEFIETDHVDVFYPDHPPRTESALFRKTKRLLIERLDQGCFICGSKEKREVHHYYAEWAFANAIDWEKMQRIHPAFDWRYFNEPGDFIDSQYNMLVLCAKHHRHPQHGIHHLPLPIWQAQAFVRDDFVLTPDEVGTKGPAHG